MPIERKPLRAEVGAEIISRIIDGRLPSGTRINECRLASDLGISRTPLREAMLCLAETGALGADMGRGFSVPHFTGREVDELLEALSLVVPAVLRQGPPLTLKGLIEARNLLVRARLEAAQPIVFCSHMHCFMQFLSAQISNSLLKRECDRLAQLLLRYFHEALARGWDPEPTLKNFLEMLEGIQDGTWKETAAGLERVFSEMRTDLGARFPATLDAAQA